MHLLALMPALAVTSALQPMMPHPALALYLGLGLVGSASFALVWLSLQQICLKPFRDSGRFEELRSAPLSWPELADGLAAHALSRTLLSSSFLLIPLVAGLPLVDPEVRLLCMAVLLRVLFVLLLGVPLASYLNLCTVAWSHGPRRDFGPLCLLAVMAPIAGLLGLMVALDRPGALGPMRLVVVAGVLLAGSALARQLALVGMARGTDLTQGWRLWWDSLVRSARRGSSGWHHFTKNPIALREFDRENASVPGGPLNTAIWVYGPFLMLQAVLLMVVQPRNVAQANLLYLALLGIVIFSTGLRACSRGQSTLSQDLDPGSWAALRQTRLAPSQVVDGVALAAWLPRSAEALLLVLGTLPVAVVLGVSPEIALPAALLTLVAPVCLAYTGVASALEGSLGQLALLTHLCTWFSLIAVYSAAILALRTWTALESEVSASILNVGCLAVWLVVVSLPFVLDIRLRAVRRLQV